MMVLNMSNVPEPFYRRYSKDTQEKLGIVLDQLHHEFAIMKWTPSRSRPNVSGLSHISSKMRRGEPCDSMVFGRLRKFGYPLQPSKNNAKHPRVWALLQELGRLADHHYTTITINHNLVCKPHKDGNIGESIIVALGDFTDGRLLIKHPAHDKPKAFNIDRRVLQFEGNMCEHWNEPFSGDRYSIVFYTRKPIQVDTEEDKILLARALIPRTDLPEYPRKADVVSTVTVSVPVSVPVNRKRKMEIIESTESTEPTESTESTEPTELTEPAPKRRKTKAPRKYHIAIPSLGRADILVAKTLPLIRRLQPSMDNVTVFTSNQKEMLHYQRVLGQSNFSDVRVVQGVKGLLKQRRFYNRKHYQKDDLILNMDDDIDDIKIVRDNKLVSMTDPLQTLVDRMANLCEQSGARLAGVYPVCNAFYMKNRHVIGLRYIVGALFLSYAGDRAICGSDRVSDESSGEDFETCIRSFVLHGNVVRLEDVAVKTGYFANDMGGIRGELHSLNEPDRKPVHEAALTRLHHAYPELTSIRQKKDILNLRLKSITHEKVAIDDDE